MPLLLLHLLNYFHFGVYSPPFLQLYYSLVQTTGNKFVFSCAMKEILNVLVVEDLTVELPSPHSKIGVGDCLRKR